MRTAHLPVVIGVLIAAGISILGIYYLANWLQPLWRITCVGVDPKEQNLFQQDSGIHQVYHLSVSFVEVIGWCFDVV